MTNNGDVTIKIGDIFRLEKESSGLNPAKAGEFYKVTSVRDDVIGIELIQPKKMHVTSDTLLTHFKKVDLG